MAFWDPEADDYDEELEQEDWDKMSAEDKAEIKESFEYDKHHEDWLCRVH